MPSHKRALLARLIATLCVIAIANPAVIVEAAAKVELTAPIKSAFDKTLAAASSTQAATLNTQYKQFGTLLEQDRTIGAKTKALHTRNTQSSTEARKYIRNIDANKLSQLEAQVLQIKNSYKPLFSSYTLVNKRISLARALKSKTLSAIFRAQAEGMKPVIALARQQIKVKEAALTAAKSAKARAIKEAYAMLAKTEPLQAQIKSQKSATSPLRNHLSSEWTNFKNALKKLTAKNTINSLTTLVTFSRQIVERQQKIYSLETKISTIISQTKAYALTRP